MRPSDTLRLLYHSGSPGWYNLYPAHLENYKKLLVLVETIEGATENDLKPEYLGAMTMTTIKVLRTALVLKEET